ncbi:MAG: lysophospholipid acyltransferase family protein [Gemmatimonadetes bacterium]|nr:lysophospholipid acyltransferase family protein [Gemmatimonadota bacterium]NNF12443.1 lysophospholipid acyltransferase family protein [Gemmatimonadota bacterium]NNL30389.1 lysophospholipid acyltransferase family protein [Gemmatimonadota bacterium]
MSLRHRLEYAAFRVLRAVLGVLPEALALRCGAGLGLLVGSVLRIRRRVVDEHLAFVFPQKDGAWRRRVARASYAHLGREAVMLFRMGSWSDGELVARTRLEGAEHVDAALAEGRGAVVLTGHLGNWEVAGAGLAARGVALDVVGKGMANRRFEEDLFEARRRLGMRVIEMSQAPKGVLRSLREGRATAIVADQNMHRNGIFVPFFGRLAATARGPALFALRAGVPVLFGYALAEEGRRRGYVLHAEPFEYEATGDLEADVQTLMAAYHARLEDVIRRVPEQYFWQHKRWKTRPPFESGEPSDGTSGGTGAARPG